MPMRARRRHRRAWFVVALGGFGFARADSLPWQVWNAPEVIARLDANDLVVETSSRCPGGCRYDRSNAGAESAADNPYPLRWLYADGDEVVVLDENGPGALTRLWLTTGFGTSSCIDPATRIRFYVDGAVVPTLDLPLAALFDGSTPPFTAPLVADRTQSSGGYVSRVPIAYAQSLRIALTNAQGAGNRCSADGRRLLWYQLQHHRLAPGASIASFTAGHDEPAWRAFLAHAGDDPWNGLLAPVDTTVTLAANASATLATRSGSGWLRGIRLHLPRASYAAVSLRVRIDGDTALDLPLADFFATAADAQTPARGVLVGEDAGGWLYAWFPMPFAATASVELRADASLPSPLTVDASLAFDVAAVPAQAGRFNASLADDCIATGSFAFDDARGAGKIVGIAARYRAAGAADRGYLEGDERAFVDDASAPAWYGTGVEDFFDGGFYFDQGAFAGLLSGATRVDADGSGVTAAYRLMLTDALPYASALRLTQEAGFSPAQPVAACARRVVYAYRLAAPLQIAYDAFEIGDAAAAAAHDHVAAPGAQCQSLNATFEGEPPLPRSALACAGASGAIHFRFDVAEWNPPLRLRRTFDVGAGDPGVVAGSAGARVFVNGVLAGSFAAVASNPVRRWQQQDAPLDVPAGVDTLDIDVVPDFSMHAPSFGESRWELRGGWKDAIFADDFDDALE